MSNAVQGVVRTGMVAVWGTQALQAQTTAVEQFFRGLDSVDVCLFGGDPSKMGAPKMTWMQTAKSWMIPGYHSALLLAREEAMSRRQGGWAGCVTGTVRSVAAGYLYVHGVVPGMLLENLAMPVLNGRVSLPSAKTVRSLGSRVQKAIGWK